MAPDLQGASADMARGLQAASQSITEMVREIVDRKSGEFNRGKTVAALERERWLPECLAVLSRAVAQMERATDQWVKAFEEPEVKRSDGLAAAESKLSRYDKVDAFMAAAEHTWLKDIRKKANVNRYEFGEKVVPLGNAPKQENKEGRPTLAPATQLGAALQQIALDSTAQ